MESDLDEAHHSTTWIGERMMERLGTWDGGGHLLVAGFIKPHHPFDPPRPWSRMVDPASLSLLPGYTAECDAGDLAFSRGYFPHDGWGEPQLRRAMAMYYATISHIDHQVGRAVDDLKRRGLYDEALILYTSDHGDYMGFRHLLLKGNRMYDPLVRVPLIVKYPRGLRAGETDTRLVSLVDLAPTLLRAAGCAVPAGMHGLDLAAPEPGRAFVFAEGSGGVEFMARSRTRKLLLCRDGRHTRFFDLEHDPLESRDLSSDPGRAAEIAATREELLRWLAFAGRCAPNLDDQAPTIRGGEPVETRDRRRRAAREYFRSRMSAPHRTPGRKPPEEP
jgi:arylsulfatase A-like enzyme